MSTNSNSQLSHPDIEGLRQPMTAAAEHYHYRLKEDALSSHFRILSIVKDLNVGPILDVGSAQGMFGELLQGSSLEIDAVEPNPIWADSARPFYHQLYIGTIENTALPHDHYQVIVCGDVLEHTVDPVAVLNQLRQHATANATFIVSLPNVTHIAVRVLVLFGYFPKMQKGILDKTHLHFFTRETAKQMLQQAGLRVERTVPTAAPLGEIWPKGRGTFLFNALWHFQRMCLALFRGLFAYQWILVAKPAPASAPRSTT